MAARALRASTSTSPGCWRRRSTSRVGTTPRRSARAPSSATSLQHPAVTVLLVAFRVHRGGAMTTVTIAEGTVGTDRYEPYTGFDAVISGDPDAAVAWLRTTSGGDGVLYTGMFV